MLYKIKYHISKKWSQDAQVPEKKNNSIYFIGMNHATFHMTYSECWPS